MAKFILRRLLLMLLTMLLVSMIVFIITEAIPGDVARHVLGRFATPEQVETFRRMLGLDAPIYRRYLYWLVGSDWDASSRIGLQLEREIDPQTRKVDWWARGRSGQLIRWKMEDGELFQYRRMPDGSTQVEPAGDVWEIDSQGRRYFWGIDTSSRAVLWRKGEEVSDSEVASAGRHMIEGTGGVRYIPLQKGLLRGDPGISTRTNRPVSDTLFRRLENSGTLAAFAFVFMMPLALALGVVAGVNEGRPLDRILTVFGLATTGSPSFATGIFLILVFAVLLQWVPGATVFISDDAIFDNPKMIILPILTLTLIELGYVLRITRASLVEVMSTPYIRTANLMGIPRRRVIVKHALRNALLAPITVIMLHVNWLIGSIIVVEALFGFPGLGSYLIESAMSKDINAIEAGTMLMVMLAVTTQLVADIIYTFLNPRIRYT